MNSRDTPVTILETIEVEIKKLLEVDAQFAAGEGEGDLSLQYWRKVHEKFFLEEAKSHNLVWNPNTQLVVR